MEVDEFVRLVREMREAQKKYFRLRTQSDLLASKRWEKLVDDALKNGITKEITVSQDQFDWDPGR